MTPRPLSDLINEAEHAWPSVLEMVQAATNDVVVLPDEANRGNETLERIQVTTRSPMGAIVHKCGGLLIDHGWIRLLGAGHPRLPRSLATWNYGDVDEPRERMAGALLVADDVLGGFFALNGGALSGAPGSVHYLPPDTLKWEDLGRGYTAFLKFLLTGNLAKFYEGFRWPGWEEECASLDGDRAFSVYPFLSAEGPPIEQRSRRPVPVEELWSLLADNGAAT
ncbi:MAG: DUF2625 domain-containing protein [Polyangiaceae bacterium]|nr:DUF2625 domain-containing protein [Polyangiaceae bacterium]